MVQSAGGLRERKIAAVAARLTTTARLWTVERGFNGFTLDELCDVTGISRRTFFNYFAGKEDAVLGVQLRVDHSDAEQRFISATAPRGGNGLTSNLLPDLAELMIGRWEAIGLDGTNFEALVAAIEAAPRLLSRALQMTREQEHRDTQLVQQREHLGTGDLRASLAVHLLGSILRGAVEEFLAGSSETSLRVLFDQRLALARDVFHPNL